MKTQDLLVFFESNIFEDFDHLRSLAQSVFDLFMRPKAALTGKCFENFKS